MLWRREVARLIEQRMSLRCSGGFEREASNQYCSHGWEVSLVKAIVE
jgi:hypothetical protein